MNPKLIMLGGVGLIILSLTTWGFYERSEKMSAKSELKELQNKHELVLAENKVKEVENNERIKTAIVERESLARQLRDNQVRLSAMQRTLAAAGIDRKCYKAGELNSAYRELVSEIRAIAGEGDSALIDNHAFLEAWPK